MRTKQLYFLLVLIIAGGFYYYTEKYYEPHVAAEMRTETLTLAGSVITARVAETPADKERGLMGVTSLTDYEGMLFPFTSPGTQKFWNQGMVIPFDLLWIQNERVIGIEKNFPAFDNKPIVRASPDAVSHVLELPAGWSDRHGVRVGDRVLGL